MTDDFENFKLIFQNFEMKRIYLIKIETPRREHGSPVMPGVCHTPAGKGSPRQATLPTGTIQDRTNSGLDIPHGRSRSRGCSIVATIEVVDSHQCHGVKRPYLTPGKKGSKGGFGEIKKGLDCYRSLVLFAEEQSKEKVS
jgi:hypothetical protein